MKSVVVSQEKICLEMKIRLIDKKLELLGKGKNKTKEYAEITRKLDLLEYGVDINKLIEKI
jgi:hypothetical protein